MTSNGHFTLNFHYSEQRFKKLFLHTVETIYHRIQKKSLQYCMCNFNKFKVIFIIFVTNHPETPVY